MPDTFENRALEFAARAHGNQRRKYRDEAYIEHPKRVAEMVKTVTNNPVMVCAAYLHDVVEDTPITISEIEARFGKEVARLVNELTDEFTKEKYPRLNRRRRKIMETQRTSQISPEAQTIKLADIIDNLPGISQNDPDFAQRYIPEMEGLVEVLRLGNPKLWELAKEEVRLAKNLQQS